MTVDLDALIAEANRLLAENQWTSGWGVESLAERLTDALESTLAELRQERERADEAASHAVLALAGRRNAVAALSRAEETIERVKRVVATSGTLWRDELRINYGALSDAITEYDKQKEQTND